MIFQDKPSTQKGSTVYPLSSTPAIAPGLRPHLKGTEATPSKYKSPAKPSTSNKAEIVPGSVQVSPLRQMEGVSIDLVVEIKMKSGGSRTVNMQIECPKFIPKRIMVDGKWHNIA
ncbi:hypothetical protein OESDEN_10135 [Oesophagostomum dentatum]|uniref:Uncharacterized protein n=1 Tax=Oesophagostomum dentatum TaxID=61180 RepID=A0A0B1SYH1_OESDE|nr:hypothetical protein OESDEN_10135 [Oesophagostomum dentatum]